MSNVLLNMNEIRRLSKQCKRDILKSVLFKNETMYFTDARFIVIASGFKGMPDCCFDPNHFNKYAYDYPNLDFIIKQQFYDVPEWKRVVVNNEIVWQYKHYYVNDSLLDAINKLVIKPKAHNIYFKERILISDLQCNVNASVIKANYNDLDKVIIYAITYKMPTKENDHE